MAFPYEAALGLGLQAVQGIVQYSQANRDRNMRRGIYEAEVRRREKEMKLARDKMALERHQRTLERSRSYNYQEQLMASPWRKS